MATREPQAPPTIKVVRNIRAAFDVTDDESKDGIAEAITRVQKLVRPLPANGVSSPGTRPAGGLSRQRRLSFFTDTEPILSDRLYTVATQSGMLAGYDTFAHGEEIRQTEVKVNELIERKMQSLGTIRPPETGKVQVVR